MLIVEQKHKRIVNLRQIFHLNDSKYCVLKFEPYLFYMRSCILLKIIHFDVFVRKNLYFKKRNSHSTNEPDEQISDEETWHYVLCAALCCPWGVLDGLHIYLCHLWYYIYIFVTVMWCKKFLLHLNHPDTLGMVQVMQIK